MNVMKNPITTLLGIGQRFSALDFGVFKVLLLCIGIVLGITFLKFFLTYRLVVWILLLVALVWLIIRMAIIHSRDR